MMVRYTATGSDQIARMVSWGSVPQANYMAPEPENVPQNMRATQYCDSMRAGESYGRHQPALVVRVKAKGI